MKRALGLGLWPLVISFGCGLSSAPRVLGSYTRALKNKDGARAYELLSEGERVRVGRGAFIAHPPPPPGPVAGRAIERARLLGQGEVVLEQEGRGWAITRGILEFYDATTPRAALRAFVRAVEHKRYDVLYQLAPSRAQAAITLESLKKEMEKSRADLMLKASRLKSHLEDPIEVRGEGAVLFYPQGGAELLFEDGEWRVVQIR